MFLRFRVKMIRWMINSLPAGEFRSDLTLALARAVIAQVGRERAALWKNSTE